MCIIMGLEANFKPKHQLGALHLCRKGQILLLAESWDRWLPAGASAAAASAGRASLRALQMSPEQGSGGQRAGRNDL